MKVALLSGIFAFAFGSVVRSQTGVEPVKVTDMVRISRPDNVVITADGTKAAFTLNTIEENVESKGDYKYVTQIYVVNTDGVSKPRKLTTAKEGAAQPAWSPDGRTLAFVRAAGGKAQIFLLSLDGGEPRQLTKHAYGASSPAWSADGRQIVFAGSISSRDILKDSVVNVPGTVAPWSSERPQINNQANVVDVKTVADPDGNTQQIRAYLAGNEKDKKAVLMNRLDFLSETDIRSDFSYSNIFVVDVNDSASTPKAITKGYNQYGNAEFIGETKQVIFNGTIDTTVMPDRALAGGIYTANADGSGRKLLLGKDSISLGGFKISPSGKWIVYQTSKPYYVGVPDLYLIPVGGAAKDAVLIPFDRTKSGFTWTKDEKFLYFTSQSNGGTTLNRIDLKTKKIEVLSSVDDGIASFDIAADKIIYAMNNIKSPGEIYLATKDFKNRKQISSFNDWVKTKKLSIPVKKTFVNEKGLTVEYWVMKPTDYVEGKKYPVVLNIHGGPSAMWGPGEASMWHEFQYFCSKGYGVVYSNPRGSGGYGQEFLRGNVGDWGKGPSGDVLTSLDKAVAENWIDTSKMVITGGSYAGYLTAWIISHDNRFKAACSQRGVYDFATFFGEGNAWRLIPSYFGGYPFEPATRKLLESESPLTYVADIKTPYIIFHGSNDRRTGFVQSEMMVRSLKVLGREVEYVRHPDASHEITRAGDNRQRIDQMLRTFEFFERYIKH
ncbi:MAG: S9 family peptidase [Chitinophagaceae bacterium]|nr:MAG: S9 family peptidase [Chitinophagaceae bacterium]